jgi:hypothetical protein
MRGPDRSAGIDGIAQRDIDELRGAHIAHCRKPGLERAARIDMSDNRHVNRAPANMSS